MHSSIPYQECLVESCKTRIDGTRMSTRRILPIRGHHSCMWSRTSSLLYCAVSNETDHRDGSYTALYSHRESRRVSIREGSTAPSRLDGHA